MFVSSQPRHEGIFAYPRYCDIAFSNHDFEVECAFLEYISRNLGRGRLDSFLEVCCATGYHLRWLASRGTRGYGVDPTPQMVSYLQETDALPPLRGQTGVTATKDGRGFSVQLADPQDFSIPEAVDMAFCPDSHFHYLLRSEDAIAHLVAVARNLGRGGLYILELDHPGILLGQRGGQPVEWEVERDGIKVTTRVGPGPRDFDPVTQVRDLEITMKVTDPSQPKQIIIHDTAPIRGYTFAELKTLVKLSGVFDWIATFGDLSITQPFDASEGARCMVPVLRCSM